MFDSAGLVVSLPARELAGVALPGSVFDRAKLADAPISDDLHRAVDLVEAACLARAIQMTLIARPEMFTETVTLGWLRQRIGDIRHHLCISDGHAVRVLPHMHNHVFFYRLGARENSEAFRWLAHRAPGFLAGLASQVNTAFRFQVADGFARPPTQLLQPLHQPSGDPTDLLVFYHDVEWIIERGATKVDTSQGIQRTTYVPLTETALADQTFCNVIAALVAETYFDPSACVLLRLPTLPARTATLADRLAAAIMPLQQAKPRLPRVPSPGVFFLADDVSTAMLRALGAPATLLMHESFDFWRHPAAFYRSFASARVFAPLVLRGARAALVDLLSAALGCRPEISWLKPERVGFL